MPKYVSNLGNGIKSDSIETAAKEMAENLAILQSERSLCSMKVGSLRSAESIRLKDSLVVRLIIIPDLPVEFMRCFATVPEFDWSFMIQPDATDTGDAWEVEAGGLDSLPYHYHGTDWDHVAQRHAMFIAIIGALRDHAPTDDIFVNLRHGYGRSRGSIMRSGEIVGSVNVDGRNVSNPSPAVSVQSETVIKSPPAVAVQTLTK